MKRATRVGINGFGRMGRLALRAGTPDVPAEAAAQAVMARPTLAEAFVADASSPVTERERRSATRADADATSRVLAELRTHHPQLADELAAGMRGMT